MSDASRGFTSFGFAKTFVLPALLVFLVPAASLAFFLYAQHSFDSKARESILRQIIADRSLTNEQRDEMTRFYSEHPFSELINDGDFASQLDSTYLLYYQTFRWMIRLSAWSIVASVGVFLLAGVCVLLSLRSQQVQYWSLSVGWQVLRIFGAIQTIVQGILLVALSFWVTALLFNVYIVKLILICGILALVAVCGVIAAIFKRINTTNVVQGKLIEKTSAQALWNELQVICDKVGTAPPDHVIAGIDDNFFVTEQPITVDGKTFHGRTLYVSLSLLKQLNSDEADSVLAHEMAHFSGDDTVYSRRISPLLVRYGNYLQALYEGGITKPIFYFMHCFRALFELSLGKLRRQREFRADGIAAATTSPRDFAGAMLRIVAYSKFRGQVQQELFQKERALETASISEQIGAGFQSFATRFDADQNTGEMETVHPFDSHPPLVDRLTAVGVEFTPQLVGELLASAGNGGWFHRIDNASEIERQQWQEFEDQFRQYHERTLAYRFLPETDEERDIVAKAFPEVSFPCKEDSLTLNYDGIYLTGWETPILYREITQCSVNDDINTLIIQLERLTKDGAFIETRNQSVHLKPFGEQAQAVVNTFNHYYTRYLHASAYQQQKAAQTEAGETESVAAPSS